METYFLEVVQLPERVAFAEFESKYHNFLNINTGFLSPIKFLSPTTANVLKKKNSAFGCKSIIPHHWVPSVPDLSVFGIKIYILHP